MSTTQLFQKVFHPLLGLVGTTIPHSYRVGTYMYKNNNFGQERGMGTGLGTILQHLLKRLKFSALECKKGHGKVPYQKPWLKSMSNGVCPRIAQCISISTMY